MKNEYVKTYKNIMMKLLYQGMKDELTIGDH